MSHLPDDPRTDESLMLAYQSGDASAFDALYARYRGTLYRFLVRQCGSTSAGEDLYQEVWLTLIRQRSTWKPDATLKTFLYRIAHSRLIDHFRAQMRRKTNNTVSLDDDDAPEPTATTTTAADSALLQRSQAVALRACLDALPHLQREAFLFSEEGGLSLADIAAITGAAAEAVKSRVRYAIEKLRACLTARLEAV